MAFSDWSTVDADNDTASGVNIAENCPAANVNNWGRRIMAQLRSAFNPILDPFFASTTLAAARTALGVGAGSTSATNFDLLTNTANKSPYMTGSDAWALADLTSFGRSVIATGDATALNTLLGTLAVSASSLANPGYMTLSNGFKIQFGSHAFAQGSNSVTYPDPFTTFSIAVLSAVGDQNPTGQDNGAAVTACSTTGFTAYQVNSAGATGFWIAVGK